MKICIVTVYNSLNSGSFLQAYALMRILQGHGHEVFFWAKGFNNPHLTMLGTTLGSAITLDWRRAAFSCRKWQAFAQDQAVFRTLPTGAEAMSQMDLFIFGSDEIWNVNRRSFAKRPFLWGMGIDSPRKIAYAPSINQATLEQVRAMKHPEACLRQIGWLLVRDGHTQEVLSELTGRKITRVLDPTLLLRVGDYERRPIVRPAGDYILLYAYHNLKNKQQIANIRKFAQEKNCPSCRSTTALNGATATWLPRRWN